MDYLWEVWLSLCLMIFQSSFRSSCREILGQLHHKPMAKLGCSHTPLQGLVCKQTVHLGKQILVAENNTLLAVWGNPKFGVVKGLAVRLFGTSLSWIVLCELSDCVWFLGERVLRKKGRILFKATCPLEQFLLAAPWLVWPSSALHIASQQWGNGTCLCACVLWCQLAGSER